MSKCPVAPKSYERDVKAVTVDASDIYPDLNDLYPRSSRWEGNLTEDESVWWGQVVNLFLEDGRMPSIKGTILSYNKNFPDGENEPYESSLRRAFHREAKKAGVTLERR